jgi:hypothetical protein
MSEVKNKVIIKQLREKQEQLLDTIDNQKKTVEATKQTVPVLCGQQKDVSTRKIEAITTSKWAEILPAINIAAVRANNLGL